MNDPLVMKKLKEDCPVMVIKVPPQIMRELDVWVKEG